VARVLVILAARQAGDLRGKAGECLALLGHGLSDELQVGGTRRRPERR
jgi:hypothetical protein